MASSRYDMLLCSETLVSDTHHVSELPVSGFDRPDLLCRDKMPRALEMAAIPIRDGYGEYRLPIFEGGYCEMLI